ncbi:hypothetical protein KCP70_24280 [Salmonella enterica subsp. enterica]|nr:hypothetical protein KCP70_24280 [Salmonella enterica subsp. enterica]
MSSNEEVLLGNKTLSARRRCLSCTPAVTRAVHRESPGHDLGVKLTITVQTRGGSYAVKRDEERFQRCAIKAKPDFGRHPAAIGTHFGREDACLPGIHNTLAGHGINAFPAL